MYHDNVNSILDYYTSVGRRINGTRGKDEIFDEIRGFLNGAIPCDMSGMPPRKKLPTPEEAQVPAPTIQPPSLPPRTQSCARAGVVRASIPVHAVARRNCRLLFFLLSHSYPALASGPDLVSEPAEVHPDQLAAISGAGAGCACAQQARKAPQVPCGFSH